MRFIFKTDYAQDIKLAKHGGHVFWYGALCAALALAPWLLGEYLLAQLTFILIYGVVGVGLMLLAGFTGQFSIGHAAFFGVGAYTQAVLTGMGWPFPFALAAGAALSAIVGVVVGLPALRVKGIYLGMATLSGLAGLPLTRFGRHPLAQRAMGAAVGALSIVYGVYLSGPLLLVLLG